MTTNELYDLLMGLGALSILLFIGAILRAKVAFFQKLLLPASVIGGFIGLLLGPSILGKFALLRFPANWLATWANLPGVLIIPIFAAVPLGLFMVKKEEGKKKTSGNVITIFGLFTAVAAVQGVIGFGTNLLYGAVTGKSLYRTFGYELAQGFSGGHGTAAATGPLLQSYGLEYWETAQGVAITCATIGLLAGMLIGIFMISRANRRGETALGKMGSIPANISQGYESDINKQASLGRETTSSSSIETITIHLGLMLVACLMAFGIKNGLGIAKNSENTIIMAVATAFNLVPPWFYAMLSMYLVNYALIKLKLNWLIDTKVKARITGTLTDFAVISAIASLNMSAVAAYIVPIIIMCVLGLVATYMLVMPLHRKAFGDDYGFERGIMTWGVNTGVMITGMMLLKIVDPDYETPVLSEFSVGFSMYSLATIIIGPIGYGFVATGSTFTNFLWYIFCVILFLSISCIGVKMMRKEHKSI